MSVFEDMLGLQVCVSVFEDMLGLKEHTRTMKSRKELAARGGANVP